ncbi:uncharacterized protein LOC134271606 [Saccostrea cucullata]|uniref:uncharacterized protein LOC134271606 n=1 Tax=Saccostrea cuccullata TaxID=36930 RepID=UPI002ED1C516
MPVNYLKNLSVLDLSGNQVTEISDTVPSRLESLENLYLTDHSLQKLMQGFVDIDAKYVNTFGRSIIVGNDSSSFYWLVHENERMSRLPDNLCEFNNTLVTLNLRGNRIQSIEGINCLNFLDFLDVSENPISVVSNETFSGMPSLRVLLLANTNIKTIEPNTFNPAGTEIYIPDLSDNTFLSFDVSNVYFERRAFCNITLVRCNITFVKKEETMLKTGVKYGGGEVVLADSTINHHPIQLIFGSSVSSLRNLYKYDFTGRFTFKKLVLPCDCNLGALMSGEIEVFRRFYHLPNDDSYTCSSPEHLKNFNVLNVFNDTALLDMFVCQKQNFCPSVCTCIEQPSRYRMIVDCSNRNLTSLPTYLPETIYNIELNCSNNAITDVIPVNYLKNLSVLDLSGNRVTEISDTVPSRLESLESLYLTDHSLPKLTRGFADIDASKVWFGRNSVPCSCQEKWIKAWRLGSKVNSSNPLLCQTDSHGILRAEIAFDSCIENEFDENYFAFFLLPAIALMAMYMIRVFRFDAIIIKSRFRTKKNTNYCYDVYVLFDDTNSDIIKYSLDIFRHLRQNGYECFVPPIHEDVGDALVGYEDAALELAFKETMDKAQQRAVYRNKNLKIEDFFYRVNSEDSFEVSTELCRVISFGSKVIFGTNSRISSEYVTSLCSQLSIPNIQIHWNSNKIVTDTTRPDRNHMTLNLYPYHHTLSAAHRDLIRFWKWHKFAVLYEDNDGLIRLQDILKLSAKGRVVIATRKIDFVNSENLTKVLEELKKAEYQQIIVDCHYERVYTVLQKAAETEALSEYFHYHFMTLDLGVADISDFAAAGANITALRMVNPEQSLVKNVTEEWKQLQFNIRGNKSPLRKGQLQIPTETALMHDAVWVFFHAVNALNEQNPRALTSFDRVSCDTSTPWNYGKELLDFMKSVQTKGLTGNIEFDEYGQRKNFELDVVKLRQNNDLHKIGVWNSMPFLNITDDEEPLSKLNKTLKVLTVLELPYAWKRKDENGNIVYEGFCIDILNAIAEKMKFNYEIQEEDSYGNCYPDEDYCTGMYQKLIDRKADLIVGGITITSAREQYVDFTKPFWNLGITILFRKPKPKPVRLFSFLDPFHKDVWVYMIAIYLCVSFMFFVIARLTPYEWCNPYPCDQDEDIVENQFSVLNSMWLTIGSILQQGCELAPRTVSTRMVAGVWWFFTLIIISSYTANLAAFLTAGRMQSPIESAADLSKQTEIKYGTLQTGSTYSFFQNSIFPVYQRMFAFMKKQKPTVFVQNSAKGEERVLKGNYAYFAESTTVEYKVERDCELMQIGNWLNSVGYGIALPKGSPYRHKISQEILYLMDNQIIKKFYNKWWKRMYINQTCESEKKDNNNALKIENIGGVFVVLMGGVGIAMVIAVIEFIYYAWTKRDLPDPICTQVKDELCFALRCFGPSSKPADHVIRASKSDLSRNAVSTASLGHEYANTIRDIHNLDGSSFDVNVDTTDVLIDGFFDSEDTPTELSFRWTCQHVNLRGLPGNRTTPILLVYTSNRVKNNSISIGTDVCRRIEAGAKVIFGPSPGKAANYIKSISKNLEIPLINIHDEIPSGSKESRGVSVNLFPHYLALSQAHRDLIKHWKWGKFTMLYEDNAGLIRLQEIFSLTTLPDVRINLQQLNVRDPRSFLELFLGLKDAGENRIVIDCHSTHIQLILKKAMQVNVLTEYFHFHFTNLDFSIVDLSPFMYSGANITGMRLVNLENPKVAAVVNLWKNELESSSFSLSPLTPGQTQVPVGAALMYDAINLLYRGVDLLTKRRHVNFNRKVSCEGGNNSLPWFNGNSLINALKMVTYEGLTGRIRLNNLGERHNFSLDVVKVKEKPLFKIGTWDHNRGVKITAKSEFPTDVRKNLLTNKTLSVITVLEPPYVFEIIDDNGTVSYEGFCIDLLDSIAEILGFRYNVTPEPNGHYGNCYGDVCDGMVKQLVERAMDLAVAGMTITYSREEVIDFTKPFWNLGITILFRKPMAPPAELFKFLSPFTFELWAYVLAVYIVVSIMMFVTARLTPNEWDNPYPCDTTNEIQENQFSVMNSLWFTIGALMQQGSEISPKATSTRLVAGVWWFFTLIMISSYTANMAAFLTIERMVNPIESAEDLANQNEIKYGTLESGSSRAFFAGSNAQLYKKMYMAMKSATPSVFVKSSNEGEKRVMAGNYAYLAESTTVEYRIARNCDLMQVGQQLDSKGYGIGLPRDSPYRDKLSSAILHLQEGGVIQSLYDKWWKRKNINKFCDDDKAPSTKALELKNVGGVFVLVLTGTVCGLLMAVIEFICNARKIAKKGENSLWFEIKQQLYFAVRCCKFQKIPKSVSSVSVLGDDLETRSEDERQIDDNSDKLANQNLPSKEKILLLQNNDQENAISNGIISSSNGDKIVTESSSEV